MWGRVGGGGAVNTRYEVIQRFQGKAWLQNVQGGVSEKQG